LVKFVANGIGGDEIFALTGIVSLLDENLDEIFGQLLVGDVGRGILLGYDAEAVASQVGKQLVDLFEAGRCNIRILQLFVGESDQLEQG